MGPHTRCDHHVDQVRGVLYAVAQRANLRAPRLPLRRIAAMLARVAIALRRAGTLAIAGTRTGLRNIIVRRKSGGGTSARFLKSFFGRTEILYRTRTFFSIFAIQIPRAVARRCCIGIKRFLRARSGRASRNLPVQNCCTNFPHSFPPSHRTSGNGKRERAFKTRELHSLMRNWTESCMRRAVMNSLSYNSDYHQETLLSPSCSEKLVL